MKRGQYRKLKKKSCIGCDHPNWCPSKKISPKRACIKCRKLRTKRMKLEGSDEE